MRCPECQHENRPDAKFCDECRCVLPQLWPDVSPISVATEPTRRKPRATRRDEVAAAIGVVMTGIAVIAGIVIASPGWQRVFASWHATPAARVVAEPSPPPFVTDLSQAPALRADGPDAQRAAPVAPNFTAALAPNVVQPRPSLVPPRQLAPPTPQLAPTMPQLGPTPPRVTPAPAPFAPAAPARGQGSTRPAERAQPGAPSDTEQVMANVLVMQLGQDPAWRTALANAEAHAADSPEYTYWRRVAQAIRDGGHRALR